MLGPAPEDGARRPLLSLRGNGWLFRRAGAPAADWTRTNLSTPAADALIRQAGTLLDSGEPGPLAVTIRTSAGVREGTLPASAVQELLAGAPAGTPWRGDRVWLALVPLAAGEPAGDALPFDVRGPAPSDFTAGGALLQGPQRQADRILKAWRPGTLLQGPGRVWRVTQCDPLPPPATGSEEHRQPLPEDPGHDQDRGDGG